MHFLQIWIVPNRRGGAALPATAFQRGHSAGRLRPIIFTDGAEGPCRCNQDARVCAGCSMATKLRVSASPMDAMPTCMFRGAHGEWATHERR